MRRKEPEHANHERWLVSYADLITLLFALFVILYAMSQADLKKFKQVQQSIRDAFGESASNPGLTSDRALKGEMGPADASGLEGPEGTTGDATRTPRDAATRSGDLQETREILDEAFSLEAGVQDMRNQVQTSEDDRGLIVRLAAKDFFDDGAAQAREDLRPLLDRIGRVIEKIPNAVRVEGHVDPTEEKLLRRTNGWELSSARAAWLIRYWVKRFEMDPSRFSAAGFSSYHPLTKKKDDWSRGRNRRVEIIILKR